MLLLPQRVEGKVLKFVYSESSTVYIVIIEGAVYDVHVTPLSADKIIYLTLCPYVPAAASVMYECAWRLSAEGVGEEGLKQQLKCYLACINCLKLLPKDAAWILKPNPVRPSGDNEDDTKGKDTGN